MDVTVNVGTHGRFLHHKFTRGVPALTDMTHVDLGHTLHIVLSKKLQDRVRLAEGLDAGEIVRDAIRDEVMASTEFVKWLK